VISEFVWGPLEPVKSDYWEEDEFHEPRRKHCRGLACGNIIM
jgi:hypothetical protein